MIMAAVATAVAANQLGGLPAPVAHPRRGWPSGCLAGALWALGPTWLQARFEVPLLITTLLLNYVAALLAAYLVSYPAARGRAAGSPRRAIIPDADPAAVPRARRAAPRGRAAAARPAARRVVAASAARCVGYEMRMTGFNAAFSEYGGVDGRRTLLRAMLICGRGLRPRGRDPGAGRPPPLHRRAPSPRPATPGPASRQRCWPAATRRHARRRRVPGGPRRGRRGHGAEHRHPASRSWTWSRPASS